MTILKIDSSIAGDDSVTRKLTSSIVGQFGGTGDVIHRDLSAEPLDHLTARGQDQHLLDEFIAADTVVIGAPMYNFSVPSQLKAWIDRIAVAGKTFRYGENGPEGLAGGKRVIIALASGGVYSDDNPFEHAKSYLKIFFNFIGIEPEFVNAGGVAMGLDEAIAGASKEIELLAA